MDDLIARLEAVDHMSVEDCFLQSPLFSHAATALRAYAEREAEYRKALLAAYAALDNGADREDVKDDLRAILDKHKEPAP